MRLDEGDRLWQLLFLVRFRHRRLGNSVAGGRKVDLVQIWKQTAEGWGWMQLSLSAVDQQKTPQTDSVCHACVSASLCHPLLAIVSQKLLLKEVFLYWSVNKLSIVPTSSAKFRWAQLPYLCLHSSRNCPIFVFDFRCQSLEWRSSVRAAECELPHRTISHYSWHGCIMLDWFRCFCLSPGSDILCSLCCCFRKHKATVADIQAQRWKTALYRLHLMFYCIASFQGGLVRGKKHVWTRFIKPISI